MMSDGCLPSVTKMKNNHTHYISSKIQTIQSNIPIHVGFIFIYSPVYFRNFQQTFRSKHKFLGCCRPKSEFKCNKIHIPGMVNKPSYNNLNWDNSYSNPVFFKFNKAPARNPFVPWSLLHLLLSLCPFPFSQQRGRKLSSTPLTSCSTSVFGV